MAGSPYFLGLFGRDSLITSWQLLDYDPKICKTTLKILSRLQGERKNFTKGEEPGKILHEYYPKTTSKSWWKKYKSHVQWLKIGRPAYMSLDSTALFLIVLAKYYKKTKNKEFIQNLWPNVKRALNWLIKFADTDKDGFFDYKKRKQGKGLAVQSWKDGEGYLFSDIKSPIAPVEVQGYVFLAFKEIANLSGILKKDSLKKDLEKRAKKLKKEFNQKFWMGSRSFFAMVLGKNGEKKKTITSNPGHLLFTGICDKEKEKKVIKRLFKPDLWTSYGIRTHSMLEPDYDPLSYQKGSIWPHDNWIISQGLKKLGYKKKYLKIKKALFMAYKELGKIPEYYGVIDGEIIGLARACYPQAWSAGALLNFLLESERKTFS